MKTKFYPKNSNDLIIFLTGWGCDFHQFDYMFDEKNNFDLLLCYDYTSLKFAPKVDFKKYKTIKLLSYSAGVYVAALIKDKLPKMNKSVAVNGNPLFLDEKFGVCSKIMHVFKTLDFTNFLDFRREYLVYSDEEFEFFNAHSSHRSFESCTNELIKLISYYDKNIVPFNFDVVIQSAEDKIFNPKNQQEYYGNKCVLLPNCAHNVFYNFQDITNFFDFSA